MSARARVTYREPDDPVMASIVKVIGSEGVNLWHARDVAAIQAAFERDPGSAISSEQIVEIARASCPRSRAEVDSETGEEKNCTIDARNRIIVGAVLDETTKGGLLTLARFSAIILEAGEKAQAEIDLAIERAKAAAEFPVASVTTGKVN